MYEELSQVAAPGAALEQLEEGEIALGAAAVVPVAAAASQLLWIVRRLLRLVHHRWLLLRQLPGGRPRPASGVLPRPLSPAARGSAA
jgi:hypothetical protein